MEATEFWNKVKARLEYLGKTQKWLFDEAGVDDQVMKNRIYKKRFPSFDDSMRIFSVLKVTAEDFCNIPSSDYKSPENSKFLPVKDDPSLFDRIASKKSEADTEYVVVPKTLLNMKDNLEAFRISGDSMSPTFKPGDIVIYDTFGYTGDEGLFAIYYQGHQMIKRIQRTNAGFKIISDNEFYTVLSVEAENERFRIIGRVHYFQSMV